VCLYMCVWVCVCVCTCGGVCVCVCGVCGSNSMRPGASFLVTKSRAKNVLLDARILCAHAMVVMRKFLKELCNAHECVMKEMMCFSTMWRARDC